MYSAGKYVESQPLQAKLGVLQQREISIEEGQPRIIDEKDFNWEVMIQNIQDYISSKAMKMRLSLSKSGVRLFNNIGTFNSSGSIDLLTKDWKVEKSIKGR